jgi:hypothetical protein
MEESSVFYQLGGQQIRWTFRVSEIKEIPDPENIYSIPGGDIKRKEKFSIRDLVLLRRLLYPRPLF